MADERSEEWSIPVARYPSPVCTFRITDGTAVVRRVNDPFEAAFDSVAAGTSVRDALEDIGLTPGDDDPVSQRIAAGDRFTVRTADAVYRVETVPPTDDDSGHLVFTETADGERFGIDNVASVVSHDLRNPLDVAKSRLRAGREFDEDKHFDHVAQAHERMERIIQDVLTLARGEDVVDPDEGVALDALASETWGTVDTGSATLTVDESLPTTVADPDRLGRLFENLFRNAVEHGSTTTPSETDDAVGHGSTGHSDPLSVTVGPLEGLAAEGFYVEDDGVGIPASERDRVFEPGYSSDEHGTGLGLAIVARIAALHGWSCTVATGSEGGARIEIRGLDTDTPS